MTIDTLAMEHRTKQGACISNIHAVNRPSLDGKKTALALKRLFDLAFAVVLIATLLVPMMIIAAAIKLESTGSVFFCQRRWGRNQLPFVILKFRTMSHQAPDPHAEYETLEDDPRITRIGRFLRKSSLDELPQLINVVLGSMSLVGPRPLVAWESIKSANTHSERFLMKPGITGLTQVSGRNSLDWASRLDKDAEYIHGWSLWLDMKIVLKTPLALLHTGLVYPED